MSSKERKAELAAEYEKATRLREAEEFRKSKLSMWGRIEEADASDSVKEILHMLAQSVGEEPT